MVVVRPKDRLGISWLLGAAIVLGTLAVLAVSAAPAAALSLPPLTINNASPSATGPKVNATLDSQGSNGEGGAEYILTVSFPSSNDTGDEITTVAGRFNTAEASSSHGIINVDEEVGDANPGALIDFFAHGTPCNSTEAVEQSFSCPNFFGGFGPGVQQSYVIDTTQNLSDPTPLSSINVTVNMCGQTGSQAILADNCAPPGPAKITTTKINQHKRTASFTYGAKHATHYECELIYNKKVKYRAACSSTKTYANPLERGQYAFVVWGVNAGGGSARAAAKIFKVG
ncbi:MAG: hypothetical protein JOZ07_18810 [Solirubrobacterales bacterium]|nr:hypothetical protein [Solirubrobacterales bacterium]